MLFKILIDLFTGLISVLCNMFPMINIVIPSNIFAASDILFRYIGFMLPIDGLLPIVVLSGLLSSTKLIVSIWDRIRSFIPTLS